MTVSHIARKAVTVSNIFFDQGQKFTVNNALLFNTLDGNLPELVILSCIQGS